MDQLIAKGILAFAVAKSVLMRKFFESPAGKLTVLIGVAIMLGVAFAMYRNSGNAIDATNQRMFIDATTLKPFPHELVGGEQIPIKAPSGNMSGYAAEMCNWTADGKVSDQITYVLLNEVVGKKGPTFCPTCGRLVRPNNRLGQDGVSPPPTEAEWKKSHSSGSGASGELVR